MSDLFIFRGPPGSGKSTAAKALKSYTIVNRDALRFAIYGHYWGNGIDEDVITAVEDAAIESALRLDHNVIVDATNLNRKALRTKLSLGSRYQANIEFVDFEIPMDVAIARDTDRERTVGAKVIRGFYERYKINKETGKLPAPPDIWPTFEKYVGNPNLPGAYIVDTDGTVANHEGIRNPYDESKYHLDTVRQHVKDVVWGLRNEGYKIVALSGRDEAYRQVTEEWWLLNGIPFDEFFMRPAGDKRVDAVIKYELFKEYIEPTYFVQGAFDDRPQVLRMWRTIGVPVFDVGYQVEF